MEREKFGSRLGFILISAGCAIGLGNVYRFPIITGAYGGALFVLIYLVFLVLLGIPVMTAELAVGRRSQRSIASSFEVLEKPGQKWHLMKYLGIGGNYLLMMFYTTISGWMFIYFFKFLTGSIFSVQNPSADFGAMVSNPLLMTGATIGVIVVCFLICALGLKNGVEKITKVMMVGLFALMFGLVIYCLTLSGAGEGIKFYLVPSADAFKDNSFWAIVSSALGQSFFSLSIGIGSIAIFGSYIKKEKRLLGEAVTIVSLDTTVALMSGLIIFPAAFTFNGGQTVPDVGNFGASFLFTVLTKIFTQMPGGRVIGAIFFLFMIFASLSTVIAVFENIMSFWLEKTKLSRTKIAIINVLLMIVLSLPCIFGFNLLSSLSFETYKGGQVIMDVEDFIVSNLLLPIGSLFYAIFCFTNFGMGWDNFIDEANTGKGLKVPKWMKGYCKYVLPFIILGVLILSVLNYFIRF